MKKYMELAIKEAYKAYRKKEVPIGAIIVKNNKVIAKGYNKKNKSNQSIAHAEIIAIRKANKKIKNWRLNDCIMYVTLEPCMMCTGAILEARIKKVIYSLKNVNCGYVNNVKNTHTQFEQKYYDKDYEKMLKRFFNSKRNNL